MMDAVLALLVAIREPSPAACDAIVEVWVWSPADVPALPVYLGPAIERFELRHELWRWDHRPIWTEAMTRYEIEWCRMNIDADYPPLSEAGRLPTDAELDHADEALRFVECWLCRLAPMASPMNEQSVACWREAIAGRRNLIGMMRNAQRDVGCLMYRRRALAEIRDVIGPEAWVLGDWPIGVP